MHDQNNVEISSYAYERTLMMEQRSEIIKRLNVNRKQSLLLEQEVDGRVMRFRIRKPSTCDFEDTIPLQCHSLVADSQQPQSPISEHFPILDEQHERVKTSKEQEQTSNVNRPDETNVRRMHTALTLNEAILNRSKSAKLVIINLPGAPKSSSPEAENNCKYGSK